MTRYAVSAMLGLLAVMTLLVVLQNFVVGRQFQLNSAGADTGNSGVVNLNSQGASFSQGGRLPDKPANVRAPALPQESALAGLEAPPVPAPAMALPGFKPPFATEAVVAATENTGSTESANQAPAANAPEAQPTLAVGDLVLVTRIEPQYPIQAAQQGIQGSVTVKFTVQPDGSVSDPSVIDAKPRRGIFDSAALRAVSRWKFKPIGAPKDSTITLDFKLQAGG
ncbi:MAG TPA: energy transducer TonB [Gammaproteobacteria bacterium]|nr:energy transducer TonB [Gammaproteobacteria bacterium]